MTRKSWESILTVLIVAFTLTGAYAQEQRPAKKAKASDQSGAPLTASSVVGSGTAGQITKWTGVFGSNTYTIGDTNITEDKFGKIGIGTHTPTSLLTVAGMIETTLGGYKFPDGTVQTTAGIPFVIHDASLMGDGRSATPLGIALGGVQTVHLANGAVTTPKIADGAVVASKIANSTVVRNLNGLFDNVSLVAGSNITITSAGNTLTIAAPSSLTSVAHDSTLTGNGTSGSPLGVANGGIGNAQLANGAVTSTKVANGAIGTAQLADNAVTFSKIAPNQVVTTLNSLTDNVTLAAGSNITITPSGNTLTIAGATNSSVGYAAIGASGQVLNSPGADVVSKQVPAGSYLIFSSIAIHNTDTDPQDVNCALSTGGFSIIRLSALTNGGDSATLVLQGSATFPATTTIKVHCTGFNAAADSSALTALKVDSLQ
jgi:hypothetical protein